MESELRVLKLIEWLRENTGYKNENEEIKKIANIYQLKEQLDKSPGNRFKDVGGDYKTLVKKIERIVEYYKGEDKNRDTVEAEINKKTGVYEKIYYKRAFSDEDIKIILEGVLHLKGYSNETKAIFDKVILNLTNKNFDKEKREIDITKYISNNINLPIVNRFEIEGKENKGDKIDKFNMNKEKVLKAMRERYSISFDFFGVSSDMKRYPRGNRYKNISVYKLYESDKKYYLKSSFDGKKMMNIRLDLIDNIEKDDKNLYRSNKSVASYEEDHKGHIDMSYDSKRRMKLKVYRLKESDSKVDVTFIYDKFGDDFKIEKIIKDENGKEDYLIISIENSVFGVINWSLQYTNRVCIVEPEDVVDRIKEKLKNLEYKYYGEARLGTKNEG